MLFRSNSRFIGLLVSCLFGLALIAVPGLSSASLAAPAAQRPPAENLPAGVHAEDVLTDMHLPVAMAFDPTGRLFYVEKDGNVRLFVGGTLQEAPVITFQVNTSGERGLLGIALDPNFSDNHYIYVYYTCDESGGCPKLQNQVVRFTERDGTGAGVTTPIFTSTQTAGNHVGGNLHFGPDGKLYITIGENANPANSQDLGATQGKIHRINADGTIPADNPKLGAGALPSIYAYGLRNSFDFVFDPVVRGRIWASENGPGCDDEMNRIEAGFNYGWRPSYPCDDDNPDPAVNSIKPIWYVGKDGCCVAPTGITVYTGSSIPEWKNHIFMAVYDGLLYHFVPNSDRTGAASVGALAGIKANMDVETGPDGALWFMAGGGYQDGTLRRLVGTGQPPPPAPPATGTPTAGGISIPGSGSRTFAETGKTVSGIFLDYWNKNGGLAQQGFPISDLMTEVSDLNGKAYITQYFERAVFEYHPENQPPYNILLSQLGTLRYRTKYPNGAPGQAPNMSAGSVLFNETGKRVGGRFLDYWNKNGGLAQQGFPISDEFQEKSDIDGKTYTVQYFERAVFEYHPENQPPFDVLLSLLGKLRYSAKYPGAP
ncbi:MAG: PQQ-dependent sugar dehydrogenase [Chloroflexota bacterium]